MNSASVAPGDVIIEPLTEDRARKLAVQLVALTSDSNGTDWEVVHLLTPLDEKWKRSLLATRRGCPVGYAVVSRTDHGAHLHLIVVARGERSAGVGSLLMGELLRCTRPGILTLKVHPDNESAVRFYLHLGFDEQPLSLNGYRVFSRCTSNDKE
jgi:GNAT superfamily N-acetyltransferase